MNNILKRISEQLYDQAIGISSQEAFVKERIFKTQNYSVFQNLIKGPAFYIHIIPDEINSFSEFMINRSAGGYAQDLLKPWTSSTSELQVTSEGIAMVHQDNNEIRSYTQYLYNGIVELYATPFLNANQPSTFSDGDFFNTVTRTVVNLANFLISQSFNYPMNLYFNFINCNGVKICPTHARNTLVGTFSVPKYVLTEGFDLRNGNDLSHLIKTIHFIFGRYE